jgi:hypothetical protein
MKSTVAPEMATRQTTGDDIRRCEFRQIFQPEACRFDFAVAKLPRLNDLIRLADSAANNAYRIFNGYMRDRRAIVRIC